MKVRLTRWYNAIISALLAVLGFESCDALGNEPLDEYGCPYMKYQVKGTVTDEAGNPLPGVKVSVKMQYDQRIWGLDSMKTDVKGQYLSGELSDMYNTENMRLIAEDVDGAANGEFLSDTISFDKLDMRQVEKGRGWYEGKYELTGNFQLKRKP